MSKDTPKNTIEERGIWLGSYRRAADPLFIKIDAALPLNIRFGAGGLKSGFRGRDLSAAYSPKHSADGTYEVTLSLSVADKRFAGREMLRRLVTVAADFNGLNELEVARNIGFRGPKRDLVMSTGLSDKNDDICEALGPYPHAVFSLPGMAINEALEPIGQPKKQTTRMLKAECGGASNGQPCGYTVRVTAKWAKLGVLCPVHGVMPVALPDNDDGTPNQDAAD